MFQRSKNRVGQRVCKKLYLRCHVDSTGKNNKGLKTTHQLHSNKNCNCPAQLTLTVLAPNKRHCGYLIEAMLQHNHNHTIRVADALRSRPIYRRKLNQNNIMICLNKATPQVVPTLSMKQI